MDWSRTGLFFHYRGVSWAVTIVALLLSTIYFYRNILGSEWRQLSLDSIRTPNHPLSILWRILLSFMQSRSISTNTCQVKLNWVLENHDFLWIIVTIVLHVSDWVEIFRKWLDCLHRHVFLVIDSGQQRGLLLLLGELRCLKLWRW